MQNHYQTLGVHPTAEDVVIKAAYRVLAQKYHPDRFQGDKDLAHKKMLEINEAYRVLSDEKLRTEYDDAIKVNQYASSEDTDASDLEEDFGDDIEEAWAIALEFHPKIEECYQRLRRVNILLANSFKLFLIENKVFSRAVEIAKTAERTFLEKYFGSDEVMLTVVSNLITRGEKDLIKKLNRYILALGDDVSTNTLLERVLGPDWFGLYYAQNITTPQYRGRDVTELAHLARSIKYDWHRDSLAREKCLALLSAIGIRWEERGGKYHIQRDYKQIEVRPEELIRFVKDNVCPMFQI
jgi:curved DNA-binding protein CbpA